MQKKKRQRLKNLLAIIYKVLIYFDKLYKVMNDVERRQLTEALISEIQIYEEKQLNGQWLKSITFKLPIIDDDFNISLDNDEQVRGQCCCQENNIIAYNTVEMVTFEILKEILKSIFLSKKYFVGIVQVQIIAGRVGIYGYFRYSEQDR